MEALEERNDRRRFLRQLGIALGVGIGAIVLPSRAKASEDAFQCCRSTCKTCPSGTSPYFCDCGGPSSYCDCFNDDRTCFPAPC